jgi:ornithine cyclodeaminase/alanine dehydrogenase-like protein (mu-crystallin family)
LIFLKAQRVGVDLCAFAYLQGAKMLILTGDDLRNALPMKETIEAMKQAFASLSDGRAQVPLRTRLPIPSHEGLSIIMPAYVRANSTEALAVKIVSLFPHNPSLGLAFIQAAILVLDAETGRPAALLEGSALTAIRTGAAGGAAIDLLSRPQSRVLAVFGAGVQGRTQLEAACTVRKIETAFIFDPDPNRARAFAVEMAGRGPIPRDLRVAQNPTEAVRDADIICTATTAANPVFADSDLKAGTHITGIGSYTPDMQEVPAETVKRARVFVDSRAASLAETGDLILPLQAGMFDESHVSNELGEIVLGRKSGRESSEEITYFKSVGVAVQDAMAAQLALENAGRMKLGQVVDF